MSLNVKPRQTHFGLQSLTPNQSCVRSLSSETKRFTSTSSAGWTPAQRGSETNPQLEDRGQNWNSGGEEQSSTGNSTSGYRRNVFCTSVPRCSTSASSSFFVLPDNQWSQVGNVGDGRYKGRCDMCSSVNWFQQPPAPSITLKPKPPHNGFLPLICGIVCGRSF